MQPRGLKTTLSSVFLVLSMLQASAFIPQFRGFARQITAVKMSTGKAQMEQAKGLISKAISIGAPAYNAGDIAGCARVYKSAALEIVSLLPTNLRAGLEETIQTPHTDDAEEAWAFRRQFDTIVEYQTPFMPDSPMAATNDYTLEKFPAQQMPSLPFVVHDNVMGGVSQGQWLAPTNTFSGSTSLQNNGGFASLRWRFDRIQNWSYAKGVYLKVKHSEPTSHTFRLILKDTTCEQARGANFKNVFCNPEQENGPILIPFEAFDQMEQMGRQLTGPVLNSAAVTELGLMAIKPSVVGDFVLTVKEWGLYC